MTAQDLTVRQLVCDADCATVFGPLDVATFRAVRREAKRNGWARRTITWHGQPKIADLCPAHADVRTVM